MSIQILTPRQALNKAYLKVKPIRAEIELFKNNLIKLLDQIKETESEEFHKNIISKFLDQTYYGEKFYINTKERNDLVIHTDKNAASPVGVIIETKKPTNKKEMVHKDNLNAKAFQELVLYYMRERISGHNLEIKHMIITNIYEWYIFDVDLFEKAFAQNKEFEKRFIDFEEKRLAGKNTDFFYKEIAEPAVQDLLSGKTKNGKDIYFTHFDIRDYEKTVRNVDKADDTKLIALFKLLSPEHILKLPFKNDSNSLDKTFYTELLHIIGLTEIRDGAKKIIDRKSEQDRDEGAILENTILQLDSLDKLQFVDKPSQYGTSNNERFFNIGLELSITWINRVLFLKLLEAQLLSYHKGDKSYSFLNTDKIKSFDDLNSLFFQVLARTNKERSETVKSVFAKVPYLNSSLFEPTLLEQKCFPVSQLQDIKTINIMSNTVLKDKNGKRRSGNLSALEYMFSFLDSYDFSSEGAEEIQEDNKTLISASVLGLIFEKINGYKDGSFFTPGFITMYMSRESIRRAVINKFNESKKWNCSTVTELYNKIEDKKDANDIINQLKICDPAVGSGHFLVSALNEIIALKSELKILVDRDGKLLRDYHLTVVNDDLFIIDDDGKLFQYNPNNKESQRIQETLFHEKQTIIENCLYGVDINTNSVKICSLRLWIELLKNAYYRPGTNYTELETLPNIDINIKCGDSLIHRFSLDAELSAALKKSKISIKNYKQAVQNYRHATSKQEKREMEQLIDSIKSSFRTEISNNDPKLKKLSGKRGDLANLINQHSLFEISKVEKKQKEKVQKELEAEIAKISGEIDEIRSNKIFENAFEWRFEFPEILNEKANFEGFDVLIGNPPYGIKFEASELAYFRSRYESIGKSTDSYGLFLELAHKIAKPTGLISYIVPTGWYTGSNFGSLRRFIATRTDPYVLVGLPYDVFDDAWIDTTILIAKRRELPTPWPREDMHELSLRVFDKKDVIETMDPFYQDTIALKFSSWFQGGSDEFILVRSDDTSTLISKIKSLSQPLSAYADIQRGVTPFHLTDEPTHPNSHPAFSGVVRRYKFEKGPTKYIRYDTSLAEFKPDKYFKGERILLREIISRKFELQAIKTSESFITNKSMQSLIPLGDLNADYLLACINSKIMRWYFLSISQVAQRDDFPKIVLKETRQLPIYPLNLHTQRKQYDQINALVSKIVQARDHDSNADTSLLEEEIDNIFYALYGFTQEEISHIRGEMI